MRGLGRVPLIRTIDSILGSLYESPNAGKLLDELAAVFVGQPHVSVVKIGSTSERNLLTSL